MEKLIYEVFDNLDVSLVNSKIRPESDPLFYIHSVFLKKSGGKGLYKYYKNILLDFNQNRIKNNALRFNNIVCSIEEDEKWTKVKNNAYSVAIRTTIIDKLGAEIEMIFVCPQLPEKRFKALFKYLKLLNQVDSHNACRVIEEKEKEIMRLNKEIIVLNKYKQVIKKGN